jgi:hypothetical protein
MTLQSVSVQFQLGDAQLAIQVNALRIARLFGPSAYERDSHGVPFCPYAPGAAGSRSARALSKSRFAAKGDELYASQQRPSQFFNWNFSLW